jgi:drug/metabolite transporter (DMT)-like permease
VGWRRWTAIAVGFVGVMMVIQPQPGDVKPVDLAGRLLLAHWRAARRHRPLGAAARADARGVAQLGGDARRGRLRLGDARRLAADEPARRRFWSGSSLLLAPGYQFLMIALRSRAEFSVIGSFRYASVLWALAIGYVLWGDVPNLLALAGIAVVVGAGLTSCTASARAARAPIAKPRPRSRAPRPSTAVS